MFAETRSQSRQYFRVVDELGKELPAVEYWAGILGRAESSDQLVPLRKFVKLLGQCESLCDMGNGVFSGTCCGRRFVRVQ
jgi:hypothetical protein